MDIMKKELVIFDNGQLTEVTCYIFRHDGSHVPVAFTVDRSYITNPKLMGLPVVPLDDVACRFLRESMTHSLLLTTPGLAA